MAGSGPIHGGAAGSTFGSERGLSTALRMRAVGSPSVAPACSFSRAHRRGASAVVDNGGLVPAAGAPAASSQIPIHAAAIILCFILVAPAQGTAAALPKRPARGAYAVRRILRCSPPSGLLISFVWLSKIMVGTCSTLNAVH